MYPGLQDMYKEQNDLERYLADQGYPVLWWYGEGDTAFIFTIRQMELLAPYKR